MLRKITQGAGNNIERALSSTSSQPFHSVSLKSFSTWLDAHHSPTRSTSLRSTSTSGDRRFFSKQTSFKKAASKAEENIEQLPRFVRRQLLQEKSTKGQIPVPPTPSKPEPTFRSRHYDPSKETKSKDEIKLLEPHVLSARLKKLCDAGKIDDAVSMLKNSPLDAQNTPVWNTLIWEALKAKRYQLAYQLYVDMKRRGHAPTTRTYQTLFAGLSRIEHWTTHPKQLQNARSLYEAFQRHVSSVKRHDPEDPELSIDPIAGYIRILGGAGLYQELFDVFYALDSDGPLAPNQFIYTAMFQAMNTALSDTVEGAVKVAADARLLWTQCMRASKKNPNIKPDAIVIVAAIRALSGGTKPDHDLGFKLVSEYFGLELDKSVSRPGQFPLAPESVAVIFRLCNQSGNYSACRQFYQQIKRRPAEIGGVGILDRAHLEEVLKAEIALREPGLGYHSVETLEWMLREEIIGVNRAKIRPALSTYNLVMQACWYSADWKSATRTFDLMTGYHSHDFMDGSVAEFPRLDKRGPGRSYPPTAEFISTLLRTAQATKNRADLRQALRITEYLGFDNLIGNTTKMHETSKSIKTHAFYGNKLATAIIESVAAVLAENEKYARPEEAKKWKALATRAEAQLNKPISSPSLQPNSKTEHRLRSKQQARRQRTG